MLGLKAIYQINDEKFVVGQKYIINGQLRKLIAIGKTGLVFSNNVSEINPSVVEISEIKVQDILDGKCEGYTQDGVKVIGLEDGFDV